MGNYILQYGHSWDFKWTFVHQVTVLFIVRTFNITFLFLFNSSEDPIIVEELKQVLSIIPFQTHGEDGEKGGSSWLPSCARLWENISSLCLPTLILGLSFIHRSHSCLEKQWGLIQSDILNLNSVKPPFPASPGQDADFLLPACFTWTRWQHWAERLTWHF